MKLMAGCLLVLALSACRSPKVAEVIGDLRSPAYCKRLETESHVIKVRYLPLALQILGRADMEGDRLLTRELLDSLRQAKSQKATLSFLLTLAPADTSPGTGLEQDVLYGRLSGYSDYREAIQAYKFGLKEKIWLEAGGKKYPIANYTLEDSWGMTHSRDFFLSFHVPEGLQPDEKAEFQLVLDDIVPGLARRKITWILPIGDYDGLI